ncbi:MAG: hypothetical protein HY689_12645 [Chloroflexi bacterium]|nr:hypothetical protein [Chloroflexota bacterium]
MFSTREDYTANVRDPEQQQWYRDLVDELEGAPESTEGSVVVAIGRQRAQEAAEGRSGRGPSACVSARGRGETEFPRRRDSGAPNLMTTQ